MKSVTNITDKAIITTLHNACRLGPTPYLRERAHAVLLSHRGYSLEQIADILGTQYQTISRWIDQWEDQGVRGLYKSHGGGVPVTFSPKEVERIHELIEKEPRRIRHAKAVIEEETKKNFAPHAKANS